MSIKKLIPPQLINWAEKNKDKKILLAISGGVDSSVTGWILKELGMSVTAVFMKNWDEDKDPEPSKCSSAEDFSDVQSVCHKIGIDYHTVNLASEYWDEVFAHFLNELKAGRTPNPDILCNKEIKFKHLFRLLNELKFDVLATGHYARIENSKLMKGVDENKDQSYFLYDINKQVLPRVTFPLGCMEKSTVREIANKVGLANANKKDSTGICFIGERKFTNFVSNYLKGKKGKILDENGLVVGEHSGLAFYTIGQRHGLKLGGAGEPWFVYHKDITSNELFVTRGTKSKYLFKQELIAKNCNWLVDIETIDFTKKYSAKIRYRQQDQACEITKIDNQSVRVLFEDPQRAIAPGQSVVFYDQNICLGGGVIQ